MARRGLRVLGVARTTIAGPLPADDPHAFPFELVGLVGLADPLRPETAATVTRCRTAGIRVVMITGDHPDTARAIAAAAGLDAAEVVTGAELEALADEALTARLAQVSVIARAAPAHKLRIVQALRAGGEIVGLTAVPRPAGRVRARGGRGRAGRAARPDRVAAAPERREVVAWNTACKRGQA